MQTSLRRFVESVRRSDPAHAVLANWGLELESETVDLQVNKNNNKGNHFNFIA